MKKSFLFAMMLCCAQLLSAQQERIDLSGTWRFQADPMGFGKTPGSELYQAKLTESIMLPGSTDEGGKGMLTTARYCLLYTSPSPRDTERSRMPSSA